MKLKNFLSNVRDQNVSKRNLPLHKVLDLTDKNTIVYLKLAAKVLKRSDFTPNSLWLKVILDLLDKIESDGLPPFSGALIDPFDQLKIFFKDMFNLSFDYDDDRGVWFGGIYETRKGWDIVNDISNDEFIKLITYN